MKIAVMGAGAVGCYYGGMLARAGHEVVLIARANHVDAIRLQGLLLETTSFREYVPVRASTEASAVQGAELVLCCVKSADTQSAADAMAPSLASTALVLSLQNGVDNAEQLQAKLPQRVAPAAVYVGTEMAGDGHVRHHGRGELVLGRSVLTGEQSHAFVEAGIPILLSDSIAGALWSKLILNCACNAISAITQMPYGPLWQIEGVDAVLRDVVAECLAVAEAEGVPVPENLWDGIAGMGRKLPAQFSSTAQDLDRRKRSEIDHLNGYIVRKGRIHGIPTPVNRVLLALVKALESRC